MAGAGRVGPERLLGRDLGKLDMGGLGQIHERLSVLRVLSTGDIPQRRERIAAGGRVGMAWANELFRITRISRAGRLDARPGYPATAAAEAAARGAEAERLGRGAKRDGREEFPRPPDRTRRERCSSRRGLKGDFGDVLRMGR
ncbi:hypothetical protein JCM15519_16020 [Fundidesulfovibrio butyratiphilus]